MNIPLKVLKERGFDTSLSTANKITKIVQAYAAVNHYKTTDVWHSLYKEYKINPNIKKGKSILSSLNSVKKEYIYKTLLKELVEL